MGPEIAGKNYLFLFQNISRVVLQMDIILYKEGENLKLKRNNVLTPNKSLMGCCMPSTSIEYTFTASF